MINDIILIFLIIIFNIFLLKFSTILSNYLKIYDVPDFSRKLHKSRTPLVGGIIFIINIFLINLDARSAENFLHLFAYVLIVFLYIS